MQLVENGAAQNDANRGGKDSAGQGKKPINVSTYTKRSGKKSGTGKRIMNEEWSNDYKKKIDCSNPKGFSQKAHCAGRKKRQEGKQTKSKPVKENMEKKTLEERMQLFLEKNVPTSPSKWAYWVGQAKKKFDVYPSSSTQTDG